MLRPDEINVGSLADAQPLTLVLPRTKYEQPMLVTADAEHRTAIFLGKDHRFESFVCDTADNWKGLMVANVSLEIDETSVFDPESEYTPTGALVREQDRIAMAARGRDPHGFNHQVLVPLITGLPEAGERLRAGFRKWQVVLSQGEDKRVLQTIAVEPIETPER